MSKMSFTFADSGRYNRYMTNQPDYPTPEDLGNADELALRQIARQEDLEETDEEKEWRAQWDRAMKTRKRY